MLYPKNKSKDLDAALFQSPTAEYRAAPFWSWNCELRPEILKAQIDDMKTMGLGGFMIHPRVGLATPYLSEEFMSLIRTCLEKGKENELLTWLYDEDKWPSGFAGGLNTKDIESRQKFLTITPHPYDDGTLVTEYDKAHAAEGLPASKYCFVAAYDILLNEEARLVSYQRIGLSDEIPAGHEKWFAYMEYTAPTPYYNNQSYADVMQKGVIENFIRLTHDKYARHFEGEFGGSIPAIFTDEPQCRHKDNLNFASDKTAARFPYTTDFDKTFRETYGISIEEHLPVLVFEPANGIPSQIRYFYHDHVAERFAEAFSDPIGKWCEAHDILMTGHGMAEPSLNSQTEYTGDMMRIYRGFTLPGIDMLCDGRELTTAKQAQSAAHQYGREGVASELYGVTNWNFDFRGHKLQGDWQAALGVTCRVPHLFWVSMGGESKRDYPASIGSQSPWFTEYRRIEDHFARVNTVMTRGTPEVKIGVIHPVETLWLHYGPNDQTKRRRNDLDNRFAELTDWLLTGLLDFDFIDEALLPSQHKESAEGFAVGEMRYKTIVISSMETIRSTTLDRLEAFRDRGGDILFIGQAPTLVDALPSDRAIRLFERCRSIPYVRGEIYNALSAHQFLDIRDGRGIGSHCHLHALRNDGGKKHLFISHVYKPENYDIAHILGYTVTLNGIFTVHEYETLKGTKRRLAVRYQNGKTVFTWVCGKDDSLLLELIPERDTAKGGYVFTEKSFVKSEYPAHSAEFALTEPNVLLLDRAEYKIGEGEWQEQANILRANDAIREALGLHRLGSQMAQPWIEPLDKNPKDRASLRFHFDSEIEYAGAHLALESPEYAAITMNGESVPTAVDGYYIDRASIMTVPLPLIKKGRNEIVLDLRVGDITAIEACYLLGDFGVTRHGCDAWLTTLPDKLYFDDITTQGLPFYGANIRYKMKFTGGGRKTLEISRYRGSVIKVLVDGEFKGYIDFPPHRCDLGELPEGEHTLELIFFGNRMNTLGQLHNTDQNIPWASNISWRTKGRFWTEEYMLYPTGILTAPRLLTEE